MAKDQFRSKGTYYVSLEHDENQLELSLNVLQNREVWWMHGSLEVQRKLFRTKVHINLIAEGGMGVNRTYMDADDIAALQDPNLRYALRFADAAETSRWSNNGDSLCSGHLMSVVATNEGVDSQLLDAIYSGRNIFVKKY